MINPKAQLAYSAISFEREGIMRERQGLLEILKARQKLAFESRDFDELEFYMALERQIRFFIAVGGAAARLYKNTNDEDSWNVMYEALSDAGLLDEEIDEDGQSEALPN